jgi:hypothetical protein
MRTEPPSPSPRQPVRAGSASRHVITSWEKSAGDDSGAQAGDGLGADAVQVAQRLVIERHAFGGQVLPQVGDGAGELADPQAAQVVADALAQTVRIAGPEAVTLAAATIGLLLSAILALFIVVGTRHGPHRLPAPGPERSRRGPGADGRPDPAGQS